MATISAKSWKKRYFDRWSIRYVLGERLIIILATVKATEIILALYPSEQEKNYWFKSFWSLILLKESY